MPSPIGHILSGALVYSIGRPENDHSRLLLGITLLGSIAPDFDFLPGFLTADPAAFHHGISHSAGFALLFGTVVFFVLRYFGRSNDIAIRAALMATLAYGFHAVLDAVSVVEGARPVPLLWPLSSGEFGINLYLFGHFHHDAFADGLWSVVRQENLPALARELIVLGIPSLLMHLWTGDIMRLLRARRSPVEETNR